MISRSSPGLRCDWQDYRSVVRGLRAAQRRTGSTMFVDFGCTYAAVTIRPACWKVRVRSMVVPAGTSRRTEKTITSYGSNGAAAAGSAGPVPPAQASGSRSSVSSLPSQLRSQRIAVRSASGTEAPVRVSVVVPTLTRVRMTRRLEPRGYRSPSGAGTCTARTRRSPTMVSTPVSLILAGLGASSSPQAPAVAVTTTSRTAAAQCLAAVRAGSRCPRIVLPSALGPHGDVVLDLGHAPGRPGDLLGLRAFHPGLPVGGHLLLNVLIGESGRCDGHGGSFRAADGTP